jgi:hypothetical protein
MLRPMLTLAFIVGMLIGSQAQEPRPWAAPVQPILEVLDTAKLSGSLEFSEKCDSTSIPPFPRFRTAATTESSPLQSLREILADDSGMRVRQDRDGMIRMIESGVPKDLLKVKISHISFESNGAPLQYAAYNPNAALLHAILRAPEVIAFMKAHGVDWPWGEGLSGSGAPWPVSSPHISGSMDNVSLSEALDRVLKTFPGLWVYWSCLAVQRPKARHMTPVSLDFSHAGPDQEQTSVAPVGVPNPLNLPPSAFPGLPSMLMVQGTADKRIVYFRFFSIRRIGSRVFIVGG